MAFSFLFRPTLVRLLRRAHMYAGLFLIPWVLLYGTTAFLFNHPAIFPPREPSVFSAPAYVDRGAILGPSTTADTIASHLLSALAADTSWHGAPVPRVVPGSADGSLEFAMRRGDTVFDAAYDLGTQSVRAERDMPPPPPPLSVIVPSTAILNLSTTPGGWAAQVTWRLGATAQLDTDPSHRPRASLTFRAVSDSNHWFFRYDVGSGRLVAEPIRGASELRVRDFFTSLHTTHEYPRTFSARTVWAMFVDAMATLMLYWATSGLIMSWQYRNLRRRGALVLASSLLTAVVLAMSLYRLTAAQW
jgi:hypothetical protein